MPTTLRSAAPPARGGFRRPPSPGRIGGPRTLAVGIVLSAALHAAALIALPAVRFPETRSGSGALRAVGLAARPAPPPAAVALGTPPREERRPGPPIAAAGPADPAWSPPFVPHEIAPRLVNSAEVARHLADAYPKELRSARLGGEALLWLLIGERGEPLDARLARPSGVAALDSLARDAALRMRFRPAFARDRAVAVWIAQPIRFAVEEAGHGTAAGERP